MWESPPPTNREPQRDGKIAQARMVVDHLSMNPDRWARVLTNGTYRELILFQAAMRFAATETDASEQLITASRKMGKLYGLWAKWDRG